MSQCQHKGCEREAFIVPMIMIPAVGHAIDTHNPIKQFIDLPVCKDHFEEVKVTDFLDDTLKQNLRDVLSALHRAQPDFDRAWVSKAKIDSREYREFKNAKDKQEKQ